MATTDIATEIMPTAMEDMDIATETTDTATGVMDIATEDLGKRNPRLKNVSVFVASCMIFGTMTMKSRRGEDY